MTRATHASGQEAAIRASMREQLRQDALEAWDHCQATGLHTTAEEADAYLAKLEASQNAEAPEYHV